jgi:hypothetical protein
LLYTNETRNCAINTPSALSLCLLHCLTSTIEQGRFCANEIPNGANKAPSTPSPCQQPNWAHFAQTRPKPARISPPPPPRCIYNSNQVVSHKRDPKPHRQPPLPPDCVSSTASPCLQIERSRFAQTGPQTACIKPLPPLTVSTAQLGLFCANETRNVVNNTPYSPSLRL